MEWGWLSKRPRGRGKASLSLDWEKSDTPVWNVQMDVCKNIELPPKAEKILSGQ
jgi:hypothetical protein